MEEIRLKFSPKETGWYIGLKDDNEAFVFYCKINDKTDDKGGNEISIPWEFSGNPNLSFVLDTKTWVIVKLNKATNEISKWTSLLQIQPLKDSITSNVELEMKYRDSLVGKTIKIEDNTYKIVNKSIHNHCWTIYNIEHIETRNSRQIQLEEYDGWSFGGKDKIDVEILKEENDNKDNKDDS